MKFPSLLRLCLLLTGLTLTLPALHAADAPPPRFTLEIRHGAIIDAGKDASQATVGNILDYLRKKNVELNLALGPGVSNVVVGDMVLQLDTSDTPVLCAALSQAIVTSANQPLRAGPIDPDHSSVYGLIAEKQEHQVAVFNLTSYLNPNGDANEKSIQDKLASVTDIIFKTLKDADPTFSDAVQPHYQFHQGANLLVVTGSGQAIDVATKVVNALTLQDNDLRTLFKAFPQGNSGAAPTVVTGLPGSGSADASGPQTIPTLPGAINMGPGGRKAFDLAIVNATGAKMQAMINDLQQAKAQGSLTPEQLKQAEQRIEESSKMLEDMAKQMESMQNNNPVIIQNTTGGGSSSGSP